MKFKMKGQLATRNRLVTLRNNMKNQANWSLFSDQQPYSLNWNLKFKEASTGARFTKDVQNQTTLLDRRLIVVKWILVYMAQKAWDQQFFDFTTICMMLLIPILIDFVCANLGHSLVLSSLYFLTVLASSGEFYWKGQIYEYIIIAVVLNFLGYVPLRFHILTCVTWILIGSYLSEVLMLSGALQLNMSGGCTVNKISALYQILPLFSITSIVYGFWEYQVKKIWVKNSISNLYYRLLKKYPEKEKKSYSQW